MNIRRLTLTLLLTALCLAGAEQASASYNPGTGRWLSKDPIEESGGANLYAYVCNCPTDRIDPLGLCPFIAVSGSQVFGPTNHATLSYFTGNAHPTLNKTYTVGELIGQGATIEASVELERSPEYGNRTTQDWKVWREDYDSTPGYTTQSPNESLWVVDRVGISYILYAKGYGTGNMAAVYVNSDEPQVKMKWESMISQARSYRWASQDKNSPANFPNSIYGDPSVFETGNNSNTFARYILNNAGLDSDLHSLLGGFFPGNNTPSNINNVWSGIPVQWNAALPPHP